MQTTTGNDQQVPPQPGADTAQRLNVNALYIKDLSFENPRAPQSLQQQQAAPAVDINVDVNAQPLGPETYEVVLTVNASAKANDEALFILELVYGAVVTAHNVPRDMPANIHAGEAVLSKPEAQAWRKQVESGNGGGGDTVHNHTWQVNAMDVGSFRAVIHSPAFQDEVVRSMSRYLGRGGRG